MADRHRDHDDNRKQEYAPGCPAWVLRYPARVLKSAKVTLIGAWSRADHDAQRGCVETVIWVPARPGKTPSEALHETLAEETGQTSSQVRDHFILLRKLGLAWTSGRAVHLRWAPFTGDAPASLRDPRSGSSDRQCQLPDLECQSSDRGRSGIPDLGSGSSDQMSGSSDPGSGIPDRILNPPITPSSPPIDPLQTRAGEATNARSEPTQFALIPDEAIESVDYAALVFAHLRSRIIATKHELGIKPATGPYVLSATQRTAIEQRIAEHGGGEAGVEACKRVIAVDEFECRQADRPDAKCWAYWNATTPFRQELFEQRLSRYRDDGKHVPFGGARSRSESGSGRGWGAYMPEDQRDELWDEITRDRPT